MTLALLAVLAAAVVGVGAAPGTALAANETMTETATVNETATETATPAPTTTTQSTATQSTGAGPAGMSGAGTAEDPYVITSGEQFRAIREDPDAHYVLESNLQLGDEPVETIGDTYSLSPYDSTTYFNGTLDGQGHTVSGLTIHGDDDALFGTIGRDGAVENVEFRDVAVDGAAAVVAYNRGDVRSVTVDGDLAANASTVNAAAPVVAQNMRPGTVADVDVTATVTGDAGSIATLGGAVGVSSGTVEDVSVAGSVVGNNDLVAAGGAVGESSSTVRNVTVTADVAGGESVGGVVGEARGETSVTDVRASGDVRGISYVGGVVGWLDDDVTLRRAAASGAVDGTDFGVGGLVGKAEGAVVSSAATSDVTGANESANAVGGLVGRLSGSVATSYAIGSVSGDQGIGGLVGSGRGEIHNSYAAGHVDGRQSVVPFAEGDETFDVEDGYYVGARSGTDVEVAGTVVTPDAATGASATSAFDGLDVGGNWTTTDHYPRLAWQDEGWDRGVYAHVDGAPATVATNTTLALDASGSNAVGTDVASYEWTVEVTTSDGENSTRTATGPTVDVTVDDPGQYTVSLVVSGADGSTATVTELFTGAVRPVSLGGSGTPTDPYRIDAPRDFHALDDAPSAVFAVTEDVDASETATWNDGAGMATVSGQSGFTAFQGHLDGNGHTVANLTIAGRGLLATVGADGEVYNLTLANVTVDGTDEYEAVGAIAGENEGVIRTVGVTGTVDGGESITGGVVGSNVGRLFDARVDATVTGGNAAGGVVGANRGPITDASVAGNVTSTGANDNAGGVAGFSLGRIETSTATASVTGGQRVGGLVGLNHAGIHRSSATGSVDGEGHVGGLAGVNDGQISASTATGTVDGGTTAGGLVGLADGGTLARSFAGARLENADQRGGVAGSTENTSRQPLTVDDVYYDASRTADSPVGTGLSNAEVTGKSASSALEGLDFSTNWTMTDRYPRPAGVATPASGADGDTTIEVVVDDEQVDPGEPVTGRLVLTEAPGGFAGAAVNLSVADDRVATFQSVEAGEELELSENVSMGAGNASVWFRGADLTASVQPGDDNVTLAQFTLATHANGETAVEADVVDYQDDAGEYRRPATWSDEVTVGYGSLPPAEAWQVQTAESRIGLNRTVDARVIAPELPYGIAGYAITITAENATIAGVENVSAGPGFDIEEDMEMGPENSSVWLRAADLNGSVQPGAEFVTLATLDLRSRAPGETAVTVTVEEVQADDGSYYAPPTADSSLGVANVSSEPINGTMPQDVDGNWKYEDLSGNGEMDFKDVTMYFEYMYDPVMTDHVRAYDYTGNGEIDYQDLIALFEMV